MRSPAMLLVVYYKTIQSKLDHHLPSVWLLAAVSFAVVAILSLTFSGPPCMSHVINECPMTEFEGNDDDNDDDDDDDGGGGALNTEH